MAISSTHKPDRETLRSVAAPLGDAGLHWAELNGERVVIVFDDTTSFRRPYLLDAQSMQLVAVAPERLRLIRQIEFPRPIDNTPK